MKKKLFIILSMAFLLALTLGGSALACVGNPDCSYNFYTHEYVDDSRHIIKCRSCGTETYEHHWPNNNGRPATCTTPAKCGGCKENYGEPLGHDPGAAATCTTAQVCVRSNCGAVLTEALGHNYKASVVKATCTTGGYTKYACTNCGDSYTKNSVAAPGHWYDLWQSCEDGTHEAVCKREDCEHAGSRACSTFDVTIGEQLMSVCPVCGEHDAADFEAITDATIEALTRYALPKGELIVRGMALPFATEAESEQPAETEQPTETEIEAEPEQPSVLYAFTAAYEYSGAIEPLQGDAKLVVPVDVADAFKLVRVDVTPATETTERAETWTDVAFTYENGMLTFETNVEGLFLLVAAE